MPCEAKEHCVAQAKDQNFLCMKQIGTKGYNLRFLAAFNTCWLPLIRWHSAPLIISHLQHLYNQSHQVWDEGHVEDREGAVCVGGPQPKQEQVDWGEGPANI